MSDGSEGPKTTDEPPTEADAEQPQHHLSMLTRIALLILGWLLLLVGIAGLALPGLQGILTLLAGAAVLSVASDAVHTWLKRLLHRWPKLEKRFDHLRQSLHDRFSRR